MVFSSNIFLFLFLPLTLALYFLPLEKIGFAKYKNYLLLATSLIFYAWGEACYIWLLGLSILGNYYFGRWISCKNHDDEVAKISTQLHQRSQFISRQIKLFIALSFNLALLLYFKYANFFVANLSDLVHFLFPQYQFAVAKSLLPARLPIGISFFTFHAISCLIDIYRNKCKAQKNLLELALYIAFFPQLIAGPIVRYNTIEKYLSKRRHSLSAASYGIRRFIIGFGKKVIIANTLGEVADTIFSTQLDGLSSTLAWVGVLCYTMQIYFDFSGYSDMAIGLARLFGFKFPENFNYPYASRSIKEFWRRWHMSLSAWFRDYVYIPLGGNKVGLRRQYFNLVLVFFLCGLWHGASWNYVVWGLFHGFFLVFERVRIGKIFLEKLPNFLQHFYAIFIVIIGWVFFRSQDLSYAMGYLDLMFFGENDIVIETKILRLVNSHFVWVVGALSLIGFSPLVKNAVTALVKRGGARLLAFDLLLLASFIFAIIRLSSATHNPFIYFQF